VFPCETVLRPNRFLSVNTRRPSNWTSVLHVLFCCGFLWSSVLSCKEALQDDPEAPALQWKRSYEIPYLLRTTGFVETRDGGVFGGGTAARHSGKGRSRKLESLQVFALKTDRNGDEEWIRRIAPVEEGAIRTPWFLGNSCLQTKEGRYIIVGSRFSSDHSLTRLDDEPSGSLQEAHAVADVLIVGLSPQGDTEWIRTVGDADKSEFGTWVDEVSGSGYIITGWSEIPLGKEKEGEKTNRRSRVLLLRTDSAGKELWFKVFERMRYHSQAYCVRSLPQGGFILSGFTAPVDDGGLSPPYPDSLFSLWRTDNEGKEIWSYSSMGYPVRNGGVIFKSMWSLEASDSWMIRRSRWGRKVAAAPSGGFVSLGTVKSKSSEDFDVLVVKVSEDGRNEWTRIFGQEGVDAARDIAVTRDGGFLIAGWTQLGEERNTRLFYAFVLKINPHGEKEWCRVIGPGVATSVIAAKDGGVFVAGLAKGVFLAKLGACPAGGAAKN